MENFKLFHFLLVSCILTVALAIPFKRETPTQSHFCTGESILYKFETGKEYKYDYETETQLWINDVTDDAKSTMKLKSNIVIQSLGQCSYQLRMEGSSLSGESLNQNDLQTVLTDLDNYRVVFRMNQQGELDDEVRFQPEDTKQWSRNIKRAIISILQVKSKENLREVDKMNQSEKDLLSATVFEKDSFGKCRTTYTLSESLEKLTYKKVKSLHACESSNRKFSFAHEYVPYKTFPEFESGKVFSDDYECKTIIENGLLNDVMCKVESVYKVDSRSKIIVNQRLTFVQSFESKPVPNHDSWKRESIEYNYDSTHIKLEDEFELEKDFDVINYMEDLCNKRQDQGLPDDFSTDYKKVVLALRNYKSSSELVTLIENVESKCSYAEYATLYAMSEVNTDESLEAILTYIDNDRQEKINLLPLSFSHPSKTAITKFKNFLETKEDKINNLSKLYLTYSKMIKSYCAKTDCKSSQLDDWNSVFERHLINDCSVSETNKMETVVTALKSIGNIGYFKLPQMLANCASKKENALEIRVNAIKSLRRFSCNQVESLDFQYDLLQDKNEDSEVRIKSFLAVMKCSDSSEKFTKFTQEKLINLLVNETDYQVYSYMKDYLKEHDLTQVKQLRNERVRGKSSYQYRYTYSLLKNKAEEVESSIVYAPNSFIPRSIRLNMTSHRFGMSFNTMDVNVRLEGLDSILRDYVLDKTSIENLLRNAFNSKEELVKMIMTFLKKVKTSNETPMISISVKLFGTESLYYLLDTKEKYEEFLTTSEPFYMARYTESYRYPLANGLLYETSFNYFPTFVSTLSFTSTKYVRLMNLMVQMNTNYHVGLNNKQKMSFKYEHDLNSRFKLDFEKKTEDSSVSYELNLRPLENIQLIKLRGRIMRLGSNAQYVEIENDQLKDSLEETKNCLENPFKLDVCYLVRQSEKGLLYDTEDEIEDDSDDLNESFQTIRSQPYNFELWIRNPDLIKSIKFTAGLEKTRTIFNFNGFLSTVQGESNEVQERVKFSYKRENKFSNKFDVLSVSLNTELSFPTESSDRKLSISGIVLVKNNLQQTRLAINNTLLYEFKSKFAWDSEVLTRRDIVLKHTLEAHVEDLNTKRTIRMNILPNGRSFKSILAIDDDKTRLLDATFNLTNSLLNHFDWSMDLSVKPRIGKHLNVKGQLMAQTDKSNIGLTVDFSRPEEKIKTPFRINFNHEMDMMESNKAELTLTYPRYSLASQMTCEFKLNKWDQMIDEFKLRLTQSDKEPLVVDYDNKTGLRVKLDQLSIDLNKYSNRFAQDLFNLDGNPLNKLELKFIASADENRQKKLTLNFDKNNIKFFESSVVFKRSGFDVNIDYMNQVANFDFSFDLKQLSGYARVELNAKLNQQQTKLNLTGLVRRNGLSSDLKFDLESDSLEEKMNWRFTHTIADADSNLFDVKVTKNEQEVVRTYWRFNNMDKQITSELTAKYLESYVLVKAKLNDKADRRYEDVDFVLSGETHLKHKLEMKGNLKLVELDGDLNIELDLNLDLNRLNLPRPASLKFKSFLNDKETQMSLKVDVPRTRLNHTLKISYDQQLTNFNVELGESESKPIILSFERSMKGIENRYSISLSNLKINLENRNRLEEFLAEKTKKNQIDSVGLNVVETLRDETPRVEVKFEMNEQVVSLAKFEANFETKKLKEIGEFKYHLTVLDRNVNFTSQIIEDKSSNDANWNIVIKGESCSGHKLAINTKIIYNLEESNIKATLAYSSQQFSLPRVASFKFSHVITEEDLSVDLSVDLPTTPVNHNLNMQIKPTNGFIKLKRQDKDLPETIFYEYESKVESVDLKIRFGLENFDLKVPQIIHQLDNKNLNSFIIEINQVNEPTKYTLNLTCKKNDYTLIDFTNQIETIFKQDTNVLTSESNFKYLDRFISLKTETNSSMTSSETRVNTYIELNTSEMDRFVFSTQACSKINFKQLKSQWYARSTSNQIHHSVRIHLGQDEQNPNMLAKLNIEIRKPSLSQPQVIYYEIEKLSDINRVTRSGFRNFDFQFYGKRIQSYEVETTQTFNFYTYTVNYIREEKLNKELISKIVISATPTMYEFSSFAFNSNLDYTIYSGTKKGFEFRSSLNHSNYKSILSATLLVSPSNSNASFIYNNDYLPKPVRVEMLVRPYSTNDNSIIKSDEFTGQFLIDLPKTKINHKFDFNFSLPETNFELRANALNTSFSSRFSLNKSNLVLFYINGEKYFKLDGKLLSDSLLVNTDQNLIIKSDEQILKNVDLSRCNLSYKITKNKYATVEYTLKSDCNNVTLTSNILTIKTNRDLLLTTLKTQVISFEEKIVEIEKNRNSLVFRVKGVEYGQQKRFEINLNYINTKNVFNKNKGEIILSAKLVNNFAMSSSLKTECNYTIVTDVGNYYEFRFDKSQLSCIFDLPRFSKPVTFGYTLSNKQIYLFNKTESIEVRFMSRALKLEEIQVFYDASINTARKTYNLYWDLLKAPKKFVTVEYIQTDAHILSVKNLPKLKLVQFKLNKTNLNAMYESETGATNELGFNYRRDLNRESIEAYLQRPQLSLAYERSYANLRLVNSSVTLANLIRVNMGKSVSLEFVDPAYKYERKVEQIKNKYIITGVLSKQGEKLSEIKTTLDYDNNQIDVKVTGLATGKTYRLNLGVYNETLANGYLMNEQDNIVLGYGSLRINPHEDHRDVILAMKWNSFWRQIKNEIFGIEQPVDTQHKSVFDEILTKISKDLKPSWDSIDKEMSGVKRDWNKFVTSFNDNYFADEDEDDDYSLGEDSEETLEQITTTPANDKAEDDDDVQDDDIQDDDDDHEHDYDHNYDNDDENTLMHPMMGQIDYQSQHELLNQYSRLAEKVIKSDLRVRKYSRYMSSLLPKVLVVEYNKKQLTREIRPFANDLIVHRPTDYAENLYQFYAELKNYFRKPNEKML